ncbi:MAG TPA: hypothetical protein VH680_09655 [Gemmatimonadales bacterium]|jgi:hypothetical protein
MPRRWSTLVLLAFPASLAACTGLVAGPESTATTAVPASRDSAYARTRRALQAESFTLDVVDSTGGHLTGTRYPSSDAKLGTSAKCRVAIAMDVQGTVQAAQVSSTSRWVAPDGMLDKAPQVCEQERLAVLQRMKEMLVPPAAQ